MLLFSMMYIKFIHVNLYKVLQSPRVQFCLFRELNHSWNKKIKIFCLKFANTCIFGIPPTLSKLYRYRWNAIWTPQLDFFLSICNGVTLSNLRPIRAVVYEGVPSFRLPHGYRPVEFLCTELLAGCHGHKDE